MNDANQFSSFLADIKNTNFLSENSSEMVEQPAKSLGQQFSEASANITKQFSDVLKGNSEQPETVFDQNSAQPINNSQNDLYVENLKKTYNVENEQDLITALQANDDRQAIDNLYTSQQSEQLKSAIDPINIKAVEENAQREKINNRSWGDVAQDTGTTILSTLWSIGQIPVMMHDINTMNVAKIAEGIGLNSASDTLKKTMFLPYTNKVSEGIDSLHSKSYEATNEQNKNITAISNKINKQEYETNINNGMNEYLAKGIQFGSDFIASGKTAVSSNATLADLGVSNAVQFLTGAKLAKVTATLAMPAVRATLIKQGVEATEANVAKYIASETGQEMLSKVTSRTANVIFGSGEGVQAYTTIAKDITSRTDANLKETDPEYKKLRDSGMSESDAKDARITESSYLAMLSASTLGIAASKISGAGEHFGRLGVKELAKPNPLKSGLIGTGAGSVENALQGITTQTSANAGIKYNIDQSKDLYDDVAEQSAMGAVGGGLAGGMISAPGVTKTALGVTTKAATKVATEVASRLNKKQAIKNEIANADNVTKINNLVTEPNTETVNVSEPSNVVDAIVKHSDNTLTKDYVEKVSKTARDIVNNLTPEERKNIPAVPIIDAEKSLPIENFVSKDNPIKDEFKGSKENSTYLSENGLGSFLQKSTDILADQSGKYTDSNKTELAHYVKSTINNVKDFAVELHQAMSSKDFDNNTKLGIADAIIRSENILSNESLVKKSDAIADVYLKDTDPTESINKYESKLQEFNKANDSYDIAPTMYNIASDKSLSFKDKVNLFESLKNSEKIPSNLQEVIDTYNQLDKDYGAKGESKKVRDNIFNTSREGFKSVSEHVDDISAAVASGSKYKLDSAKNKLNYFKDYLTNKADAFQKAYDSIPEGDTTTTVIPKKPDGSPYKKSDGSNVFIDGTKKSLSLIDLATKDANLVSKVTDSMNKLKISKENETTKPVAKESSELLSDKVKTEPVKEDALSKSNKVDSELVSQKEKLTNDTVESIEKVTSEQPKPVPVKVETTPVESITAKQVMTNILPRKNKLTVNQEQLSNVDKQFLSENVIPKIFSPSTNAKSKFQTEPYYFEKLIDPSTSSADFKKLMDISDAVPDATIALAQTSLNNILGTVYSNLTNYDLITQDNSFSTDGNNALLWDKKPTLYFAEPVRNPDTGKVVKLQYSPDYLKAVSIEATRFLAEEASFLTTDSEELNSTLNNATLTDNDLDDISYITVNSVAKTLGDNVLKTLGFKNNPKTTVGENISTGLKTAVGLQVINSLITSDVLTKNVITDSTNKKQTILIKHSSLKLNEDGDTTHPLISGSDIKYLNALAPKFAGTLLNERSSSHIVYDNATKLSVNNIFKKSPVKIPGEIHKFATEFSNTPFKVNQKFNNLLDGFTSTEIKELGGYIDPNTVPELSKETVLGVNNTTEDALNRLNYAKQQAELGGYDFTNADITIGMNVVSNGRVMYKSSTLNPQAYKLHRMLLSRGEGETIPTNNLKAEQQYKVVLAQNLGIKVHLKGIDKSLSELNTILSKPNVAETLELLTQKQQGKILTKENKQKIISTINDIGNAYIALNALNDLAAFNSAKAKGKDHKANVYFELDGISHGSSTGYIQFSLDTSNYSTEMLKKIGIVIDPDNTKTYSDITKDNSSFSDLYQTVSNNITKDLSNIINKSVANKANTNINGLVKLIKVINFFDKSAGFNIETQNANSNLPYSVSITGSRNFGKQPTTVIGAYGGGKSAVMSYSINDIMSGIRKKYLSAYNKYTKAVNEKNTNNITLAKKELDLIISNLNSIDSRSINTKNTHAQGTLEYYKNVNINKSVFDKALRNLFDSPITTPDGTTSYMDIVNNSVVNTLKGVRETGQMMTGMSALLGAITSHEYTKSYNEKLNELQSSNKISKFETLPENIKKEVFNNTLRKYAPIIPLGRDNNLSADGSGVVQGLSLFKSGYVPITDIVDKSNTSGSILTRPQSSVPTAKSQDAYVKATLSQTDTLGETGVLAITNGIQSLEGLLQARVYEELNNTHPELAKRYQDNFDGFDTMVTDLGTYGEVINETFRKIQQETSVAKNMVDRVTSVLKNLGIKNKQDFVNYFNENISSDNPKLANAYNSLLLSTNNYTEFNSTELKNPKVMANVLWSMLHTLNGKAKETSIAKQALLSKDISMVANFASPFGESITTKQSPIENTISYLNKTENVIKQAMDKAESGIKSDDILDTKPVEKSVSQVEPIKSYANLDFKSFTPKQIITKLRSKDGITTDPLLKNIISLVARKLPKDTNIHIGNATELLGHIKQNYRGNFADINPEFNGLTIGKDIYIKNTQASPEILLHEMLHGSVNNALYNAIYSEQSNEVKASARALYTSVGDVINAYKAGDTRLDQLVNTLQSYNALDPKERSFKQISELVAYTFTNPDVMKATMETKTSVVQKTYTAFRKFVGKMLSMLGVTNVTAPIVDSVFTQVFANTQSLMSKTKLTKNYLDSAAFEQYHASVKEFSEKSYQEIFDRTPDTKSSEEHVAKLSKTWNSIYSTLQNAIERNQSENNLTNFDDVMFRHELETPNLMEITNKLAANGFTFTPKEQLVFNGLHTVFEYAVTSPKFEMLTHSFEKIYTSAKNQITPEMLVSGSEPVSLGEARYNALFDTVTDNGTKSTRLANFIGLYGSSEHFKNVVDSLNNKQSNETDSLFNTLLSKAVNYVGNISSSKNLGKQIQKTIDKLTYINGKSRNDLLARISDAETKFDSMINNSDNMLAQQAQKVSDQLNEFGRDLLTSIKDDPLSPKKVGQSVVGGVAIAADTVLGKNNPDDLLTITHKLLNAKSTDPSKRLGTAGELVNEMIGVTSKNKELTQMLAKTKFTMDHYRNSILSNVPKAITQLFTDGLTDKQSSALKEAVMDTDASIIFNRFNNIQQLEAIYRDPVTLRNETVGIESDIANLIGDTQITNFVLNQADGLGKLIATGTSGMINQAPNAKVISNLVLNLKNKSLDKTTVDAIDMLASLRAIQYSSDESKALTADLIKTQPEAVKALSNVISNTRETELNKVTDSISGLAIKGGTPSISDPSKSIVIADASSHNDLVNQGYTKGSKVTKSKYDSKTADMYYYYADNLHKPTWVSGVMSPAKDTVSGNYLTNRMLSNSNIVNTYANENIVNQIVNDSYSDFNKQFNQRISPDLTVNHPLPHFESNGTIKSYSQPISKAEYNARTNANTLVQDNIATWQARNFTEQYSEKSNKELVDLLYRNYKDDIKSGEVNAHVAIDPNSKDKYIQEVYSMIPPKMRSEISKVFPDGILRVRRTDFNNALGMREWSIGEILRKSPEERSALEEALAQISKVIFGDKAEYRIGIGTRYLKAYAKKAKNFVLVKNFAVLSANIISNIAQARAYNISFSDTAKDYVAAYTYAKDFNKHSNEKMMLEEQKVAYADQPQKIKAIDNRLNELDELLSKNPAAFLINKGLLPTVDTQDTPNSKYELGYNMFKSIENGIAKLPKGVNTAVSNLAMMENSSLYQTLNTLNQYSDFMARYSLYKQLTERNGEHNITPEQAIDAIQDEFVDYNLLPSRTRQALDSMGFTWFLNYRLRSQKLIMRMARKSPLKLAGQVFMTNEGVPTLLDTNMITGNNTAPFGLFNGVKYITGSMPFSLFSSDDLVRLGK